MAIEIFPDVYTYIEDKSFYVQPLPGTIGFIALVSEKGPDNKMWLSTGPEDLINTFGKPNKAKYGEGMYVAYNFNTVSSDLYVLRVLPNDATYSNLVITYDHATTTLGVTSENDYYSESDIITDIGVTTNLAIFYPIARGQWYNNIQINLTPSVNVTNAYDLDIYVPDDMGNPVIVESFVVSFIRDTYDYQGDSLYITDVLDKYSQYVRCLVNDTTVQQAISDGITNFSTVFTGPIALSQGTDGSLFDANGNLDWSVAEGLLTNAYAGVIDPKVVDTEFTYFNLVFDAGYPQTVKDQIVALCQLRQDCFGVLDMGHNTSASSALSMRNTTYNYNTWYVALYEMYSRVYDIFNNYYIDITPVYHMSRIIAQIDRDYDMWYAPAGLKRAMIPTNRLAYEVTGGYKNQFILNQINMIMHFRQGFVMWNESTAYQSPSKLQSIHIVRPLIWLRRVIKDALRWFIWDANDETTWTAMKKSIDLFLSSLVPNPYESASCRVYATEYDKKIGRVRVDIFLKPKGVIKVIKVTIVVQ